MVSIIITKIVFFFLKLLILQIEFTKSDGTAVE